jgi:hypothetical protein
MTAKSKRSRSSPSPVLPLALFSLIYFVIFWKNLYWQRLIPVDGNMLRFMYPHWAIFKEALRTHGQFLWNPLNNMGEPFLADPGSLVTYPFQWMLGVLPDYLTYLQAWVGLHTLLASGMAGLLAWRWYKDLHAAVIAAVLFGFNGFFSARVTLPMHLAAAAYLPAIIYFLDRGSSRGLGLMFALQWMAGFPSFSILSVVCSLIFALCRGPASFRCWAKGGIWGIGLSCVQWFPFLEMLEQSVRDVFLSSTAALEYSLSPLELAKVLLLPQWYAIRPALDGDPAIMSFYVGLVALGLAAFAAYKGTRIEKVLGWGTGIALLLSLGSYLPGYASLHPLHLFRFPANWLLPATLGIALLCAAGLSRISDLRWKNLLLGIIALDLLVFGQYTRVAWAQPIFLEEQPELAEVFQTRTPQTRLYHPDRMTTLWVQQGAKTAEDLQAMKDLLIPSYATAFGIAETRSYQVLRSRRAAGFHERLREAGPRSPLWDLAGISTMVTVSPQVKRIEPTQTEILRNNRPLPPLYWEDRMTETIQMKNYVPGRIEAIVNAERPQRLIFREVYYPGWKVQIDHAESAMDTFVETFMAVKVPAGQHRVTFRYEPLSVRIGLLLSIATLTFLLGRLGRRWLR